MGISVVSTTFTPASTGYSSGQDIGGLMTLPSGAGNNLLIRIRRFSLAFGTASSSAAGIISGLFLTSAPATSLADTVAPTWLAADAAKMSGGMSAFAVYTAASLTLWETSTSAASQLAIPNAHITDTLGNIYMALIASAAITYTTPTTATLKVEFEY